MSQLTHFHFACCFSISINLTEISLASFMASSVASIDALIFL